MPLQPKQRSNKFTYISIIISQKQCGVAVRAMEILGGVTSTLTRIIGSEVSISWLVVYVPRDFLGGTSANKQNRERTGEV